MGLAGYYAWKSERQPGAERFAAVTAVIFAAQMLNFPVSAGTSGHLLGGVLASAVLGVPFGVLSLGLVVGLQTVFFADGGFTVLGANICNMALIGAGLGGLIRRCLKGGGLAGYGMVFASAWLSVMLAALAVCVELSLSGTTSFSGIAGGMLLVHGVIGIGEGVLTVLGCALLGVSDWRTRDSGRAWIPALLAATVMAMALSPFASGLPDGLEWMASRYFEFRETAPLFVSPLADYNFPGLGENAYATMLGGLSGVLLTFVMAYLLGLLFQRRVTD